MFVANAEGDTAEEAKLEDKVYTYKPPEAKDWVPLGSNVEVEDEMVVDTREKVVISFGPIYIYTCVIMAYS